MPPSEVYSSKTGVMGLPGTSLKTLILEKVKG